MRWPICLTHNVQEDLGLTTVSTSCQSSATAHRPTRISVQGLLGAWTTNSPTHASLWIWVRINVSSCTFGRLSELLPGFDYAKVSIDLDLVLERNSPHIWTDRQLQQWELPGNKPRSLSTLDWCFGTSSEGYREDVVIFSCGMAKLWCLDMGSSSCQLMAKWGFFNITISKQLTVLVFDDIQPNWGRITAILNNASFIGDFSNFWGHNDLGEQIGTVLVCHLRSQLLQICLKMETEP